MTYQAPEFIEPNEPTGTVAELFAGVGGFRLGLARSSWKTVYSNQWEPSSRAQHASDVYICNFGPAGHSNDDIFTVGEIPEKVDMIVGGFPCQDYSVATSLKSSLGLEGKKGVLWWEMLRLIKQNQPRWVMLENVDRMLKSPRNQRGRDFAVILKSLGSQGYRIEWRVINAAEYGMAQRRRRVFIVAERIEGSPDRHFSEGTIFSGGLLSNAFPVLAPENPTTHLELRDSIDEISESFGSGLEKSPFQNAGVYIDGIAQTSRVAPDYRGPYLTLGDVLVDENCKIPEEFFIPSSHLPQWKLHKGSRRIPRTSKVTGYEYIYNQGSMRFPDPTEFPSRTILTSEGGKAPSRFTHAVAHGNKVRRLLPIELERLSGFPDDWTASGQMLGPINPSKRAFLIGNALVVGIVERIGHEIARRVGG